MANKLSEQLAQNAQLVALRESMGDISAHARNVDHLLVFRGQKTAKAAQAELEALGYQVQRGRFLFEVHLDCVISQATDLATQNATTSLLGEIAARNKGYYDGWGSTVETAADIA